MSWMDSWSRPSKSQATPAPFYLLPGGENTPYCKSCGRVISSRKSGAAKKNSNQTPAKYCSSRCHGRKVGPVDRKIEDAFVAFLNGATSLSVSKSGDEMTATGHTRGKKSISKKKTKGDARILVSCSTVEEEIFGPRGSAWKEDQDEQHRSETAQESEKDGERWCPKDESGSGSVEFASTNTNAENSATTGSDNGSMQHAEEKETLDPGVLARMSIRSGTRRRPPQNISEVNGSVGGEKGRAERIDETDEMRAKRLEGERRTEEREQVRRAARRGVVFGFLVGKDGDGGQGGERRKCEAVMRGKVVEPSFAKGEWGIRWRE